MDGALLVVGFAVPCDDRRQKLITQHGGLNEQIVYRALLDHLATAAKIRYSG
jgi:hypothetical protein